MQTSYDHAVFEPGSVVEGKYRIDRVIGRGGMGIVVAATHLTLGTRVALKCMKHGETDVIGFERFMREARAAAQLHSDHICRVLDVGDNGGMPYIVMELLDGSDLGRLARSGPIDVSIAVDHVREACAGLAKAHACGIVHRDLKPENLFLAQRADGPPIVKLLDFGVAKAPDHKALTASSQTIGSPAYMSPEQILSSRDVDARSDVWSLGVILYRLISGRMPFAGINPAEIMLNICEQDMPAIATAPADLVAVIARCLDKDPANRFETVDDLASALRPFGTEVRDTTVYTTAPAPPTLEHPTMPEPHVATREYTAMSPETTVADTVAPVTTPRPAVRAPRRRARFVIAAVVTVALGSGLVSWLLHDEEEAPVSTPSSAIAPAPPPPPTVEPVERTTPAPTAEPRPDPEPAVPAPAQRSQPHTRPRPKAPIAPTPLTDEQLSRSRI